MAVALNAVTLGSGQSQAPALNHDPQGTDRALIVALAFFDPLGFASLAGVTFGGAPMTELGVMQGVGGIELHIFRRAAPPAGSAQVAVTLNDPGAGVGFVMVAASYTGTHQSNPTGTVAVASGAGTETECMVADTVADSMVFDAVLAASISATMTGSAHGGQVELAQQNAGTGINKLFLATSEDYGGGLATMAWTLSHSRSWVQKGVEVRPAPTQAMYRRNWPQRRFGSGPFGNGR